MLQHPADHGKRAGYPSSGFTEFGYPASLIIRSIPTITLCLNVIHFLTLRRASVCFSIQPTMGNGRISFVRIYGIRIYGHLNYPVHSYHQFMPKCHSFAHLEMSISVLQHPADHEKRPDILRPDLRNSDIRPV